MKKILLSSLILLPAFLFSQGHEYEASDIIVSLTASFGNDQPNSVYVEDPLNGSNLVSATGDGYDLKFKSKGIGLSASYFFNEFISAGFYLNQSVSRAVVKGIYNEYNNRAIDADNDGKVDDRLTRVHTERRTLRTIWTGVNAYCHYSHFIPNLPEELDLYAGVGIGAGIHSERVSNIEESDLIELDNSNLTYTQNTTELDSYNWRPTTTYNGNVIAGARYYFKDNLAANVEAGLLGRYLAIGLTMKL